MVIGFLLAVLSLNHHDEAVNITLTPLALAVVADHAHVIEHDASTATRHRDERAETIASMIGMVAMASAALTEPPNIWPGSYLLPGTLRVAREGSIGLRSTFFQGDQAVTEKTNSAPTNKEPSQTWGAADG